MDGDLCADGSTQEFYSSRLNLANRGIPGSLSQKLRRVFDDKPFVIDEF
jgi:hypothetical protein